MNVLGIELKTPSNKALLAVSVENMLFFMALSFFASKNLITIVDFGSYLSGFFIGSLLLVSGLSLKEHMFKSIAILMSVSVAFWYILDFVANKTSLFN